MEQSPSSEANRFSASQGIPRMLWKPKVPYRSYKCPPPVPILGTYTPFPIKIKKKSIVFSLSGLVRLGEYNTNTHPDRKFDVRADPLQDWTLAEFIVQTDYGKTQFKHDISLILLDRHVIYSGNLQVAVCPACLSVAAATAVLLC
jgi:hypothetical protein